MFKNRLDNAVGLNLNLSNIVHTRSNSYKLIKHRPNMTWQSSFFLKELLNYGIASLLLLYKLKL